MIPRVLKLSSLFRAFLWGASGEPNEGMKGEDFSSFSYSSLTPSVSKTVAHSHLQQQKLLQKVNFLPSVREREAALPDFADKKEV